MVVTEASTLLFRGFKLNEVPNRKCCKSNIALGNNGTFYHLIITIKQTVALSNTNFTNIFSAIVQVFVGIVSQFSVNVFWFRNKSLPLYLPKHLLNKENSMKGSNLIDWFNTIRRTIHYNRKRLFSRNALGPTPIWIGILIKSPIRQNGN